MWTDTLEERILRAAFWVAVIFLSVGYVLGLVLSFVVIDFDADLWSRSLLLWGIFGCITGALKCYIYCQLDELRNKPKFWYIAHVIMRAKYDELPKTNAHIPVWENMILVHAGNDDDAYKKAEKYGKEDSEYGPANREKIKWKENKWEFVGVRKLIKTNINCLIDGAEVTCNELLFNPYADIDGFSLGNATDAQFIQVNIVEGEGEAKYWLAWYVKNVGATVLSVGEMPLKGVLEAEIETAFRLKKGAYADCLEVGQDQINWLKSKGHVVDLNRYDYFVEIMAP